MEQTIYYTVELQLDSSYSWNGLRTITGFRIGVESWNNTTKELGTNLFKMFELICKTDGNWQYLLSDEEEIQQWLDDEKDENDYKFIKL